MSSYGKCKIAYIRSDNRNYERIDEKCVKLFRKLQTRVGLEEIKDGIIILIPKYKKRCLHREKSILEQIRAYIKQNNINGVLIEEDLEFIKGGLDAEYFLNGKYIMKNYIMKILEYIFRIRNENMHLENIYVFVNNYTKNNIYIIEKLVSEFKTVNVITENLRYYSILEKSLYNKGFLITVSNNKRKSARNARYIINMDFEKDILEKYNINMNAVLINLTESRSFFGNSFMGVLVNDFDIVINQDREEFINEFYGNVNSKLFLEGCLKRNTTRCEYAEEVWKEYDACICKLIGVRGTLQEEEFQRLNWNLRQTKF